MFVVSLNYKVDLSEIDRLIPAHVVYLEACYANGVFIASGRKEPRTGGVILAQATSLEILNKVLEKDPFYIAGVAEYEVTEFIPTMTADGFETLKN
jgi:uncharacterized protein YciI